MRLRRIPLVALALGWGLPASGEGTAWSSRVWQADGLPDRTITGLAQTSDGFLWAGTPRHLSRFDGVRFEPFLLTAVAPGMNTSLRALLASRDGALWVGLWSGSLVRFQAGERRVYEAGLPRLRVETLIEDGDGALWVNYYGGPIVRLKDGQITRFGVREGLAESPGIALAADGQGQIWFAQSGRLGRFENGRFRTLGRLPKIERLTGARTGGVWIGSGSHIFRCDADGRLEAHGALPEEHSSARTVVLLEARDGALWIGTRHDGLFRYAAGRFESVPASHSSIRWLMEDREGNVWIGTGGGGLNRIQPRTVEIEGARIGLPARVVQSIAEDVAGELWGATQNGLLMRRAAHTEGRWQPVRWGAKERQAVTCVAADPRGGIWMGTRTRQLHHWQEGKLRTWGPGQGLTAHTVCAVVASRTGDVWVAGEGPQSLQRLRGGRLESVTLPPDIGYIRAMTEDVNGDLWIGGSRVMPLRHAGGPGLEEIAATRAVEKAVRSLHATADGGLWIGYEGGGLGRLKEGRFGSLGPDQGLPGTTVTQVIADGRGWMWLGMNEGVFKVRQRQLEDVLAGRSARVDPIDAGAEAGSFTVSASTCGATAAVRTRPGPIWMPLGTAVAVIHPDRLVEEAEPPAAVVERVSVDGRLRALDAGVLPLPDDRGAVHDLGRPGGVRVEPGEGRVEIDFTAPAFRAPESVRFRYRLEGLERSWSEAGPRRSATYAHLPPGDYAFHVAACSGREHCQEAGAALAITVLPQVWETWWFRLAALAGFAGAVAIVVRRASFRRLRHSLRALEWRERLHRERARIARDIHDDIGNRLTTITLLSGLVQREISDPQKAASHVSEISATARQVTDALDEIVWAVNPGNDLVPHVVSYLGQFTAELARTAGLRARLDLPPRPPPRAVSAEVRHGLFLAAKEALNNVVRHAEAGEVAMTIAVTGDWLHLKLEDDGRGFDASAINGGGHGLSNMRHRILEVGGRLELESAPGRGTRIHLHVPISAEERV